MRSTRAFRQRHEHWGIPKLLGYAKELGVEAKIQTYVRVLLSWDDWTHV